MKYIFGLIIIKNPQLFVIGVDGVVIALDTSEKGAFILKINDWYVPDTLLRLAPEADPDVAKVDETSGVYVE